MAAVGKDLFPCPPKQLLVETFVGKKLNDVPTPAAVLDRAVMGRNCEQMLKACKALKVGFRPHVKTHKVGLCLFWISYVSSLDVRKRTFHVSLWIKAYNALA